MSELFYHVLDGAKVSTVVAYDPDSEPPLYEADSTHPHFQAIVDGLARGDREVLQMFDVRGGMNVRIRNLSERITYDGESIFFDGDKQAGPLAEHLLRAIKEGLADASPIVKFWEKVASNPDERSREQLFSWLQAHAFTITEEGDILGYKGVREVRDGGYESINSGTAFVDGKEVTGKIPNNPGSVITMPRSEVQNDPNVACHKGLHIGTWSYASTFGGGPTLEVHVNPRDVVSIPRDSGAQKMRACRYTVVQRLGKHYDGAVAKPQNTYGEVGYVGY